MDHVMVREALGEIVVDVAGSIINFMDDITNSSTSTTIKVVTWAVSLVLVSVLLVLVGYGVFLKFFVNDRDLSQTGDNTTSALYTEQRYNSFATAENLLRTGGTEAMSSARSFYELALKEVTSIEQEAHIKYKIGITYTYENPEVAVKKMKEIVDNPAYPNLQKAYAVQHMFAMHNHYLHDPDFPEVLFTGEPYSNWYIGGDLRYAFKELSEFGTQFAHVPYLDLDVAKWYSYQMISPDIQNDPVKYEEYLSIVEERLIFVDLWLVENENTRDGADLLVNTVYNKAVVQANLALAGERKYGEQLQESVRKSLEISAVQMSEAPQSFIFATYALKLEDKVLWEIVRPYLDKVIDNIYDYKGFKTALDLKQRGLFGGRDDVLLIAQQYPKFKEMLIADTAWTATDFVE